MRPKMKSTSIVANIAIGTIIAIILMITITGIVSLLVLNEKVGESAVRPFTAGVLFLVVLAGTFYTGKKTDKRIVMACAAVFASCLFLLLGCNIIFFEGSFPGFIRNVLAMAAGCGASCMLLLNAGRRKRRNRGYR